MGTTAGLTPLARWWDADGNQLPTDRERADEASARLGRLREKLAGAGIDPDET